MSEEIGMSVNTINRTLQSFREEHLLTMSHGKIRLDTKERQRAEEALGIFISENRNGAENR